jgi:hypothetical protein
VILPRESFDDHPQAVAIMREGWNVYIPLSALTHKACANFSMRTAAKSVVQLNRGTLNIATAPLTAEREQFMTGQEFMEAYPRMLRIIKEHYPFCEHAQKLHDAWQDHFKNIVQRQDFWSRTGVFIEYDIRVRRQHITKHFNPATWQSEIFQAICDMCTTGAREPLTGYPRDDTIQKQPINRLATAEYTFRAPGQGSFEPPRTFRSSANRGGSAVCGAVQRRCFMCGNTAHISSECNTANLPWLIRGAGQTVAGPGNVQICVNYNTRGCFRCGYAHKCSLCGSDEHAAPACRAV